MDCQVVGAEAEPLNPAVKVPKVGARQGLTDHIVPQGSRRKSRAEIAAKTVRLGL